MGELKRMKDQMKRAYEKDAWHGPALCEVLEGVSAAQAAARPLKNAHSIWEIVLHLVTWHDGVRQRLAGTPFQATPEVDWPPVMSTSPEAWRRALRALRRSYLDFMRTLDQVPERGLDRAPVKGGSTRYVLIHGVIQHDLYHAGQIALLKKKR